LTVCSKKGKTALDSRRQEGSKSKALRKMTQAVIEINLANVCHAKKASTLAKEVLLSTSVQMLLIHLTKPTLIVVVINALQIVSSAIKEAVVNAV